MAFLLNRRQLLKGTLGGPMSCLLGTSGCGGSGSQGAAQSAAPVTPVTTEQGNLASGGLFAVEASDLQAIITRPEWFLSVFEAQASGSSTAPEVIRAKLGTPFATLEDQGCLTAFATYLAYTVAPSGDNSVPPIQATLSQLVSASALNCGQVCKLTTLLSLLRYPQLIPPDAPAGGPPKPTIHFLVWLENVPLNTGVHSQLVVSNVLEGAYLLLDPFYAFAMRIPYAGGYPHADLTVVDNAAALLQFPIAANNFVTLDARGPASNPVLQPALTGGQLNPSYVYHDYLYGSEGWDVHVASTFLAMS